MATAGAVVDRLLRRLASDARQLELPSNIDGDVAHVRRTLSTLQDVLVYAEGQYFKMVTEVRDWMWKIKQIACDMDDYLDGFGNRNSSGSESIAKAPSFCSSNPFLLYSIRVTRMKALRRRLDLLAKDSIIFSLMQNSNCDFERSGNQDEFDSAAVIGRDNDKAKIKDLILQTDADTLSIIPIVGLVGLGQTTLARLIFCDQGQGWNWDFRIWVDLNRKLDLKKIARDIISQAHKTKEGRSSEVNTNTEIHENLQLLKNCLQGLLHDKRCLIVLNDLSSTDKSKLNELKEMLSGTGNCIKILVTTSSEMTAELMHTVAPYKLLPLSEDDCWTIFSEKAFGDGDSVNARLKEIGKQIVKRCEGIPALAHSLGSIVHNQVMDVWLAVRDEALWKLEETYSPKIQLFSSFYKIYHDMPSALKLCFLYLSIFPKGSAVDKEELIRQWIALDMIGSRYETLPSYVHGEMYIQDLLSIHFLQVQKTHSIDAPATTSTGHGRSIFKNIFQRFSTSPTHKELLASMSINSSTVSEDLSTISSNSSFAESPNISIFTMEKLRIATRNFSPENILGEGWSGKVYKGQLQETRKISRSGTGMTVAVKNLKPDSYEWVDKRTWQNEMNLLGKISHPNIVKLIGYAADYDTILMVYEFMPKGSLENHLFRRGQNLLSWSLRIKILIGAARGLAFLHSRERPVIHRNLKTSKVLLDSNYNGKLADLRLAKDAPDVDRSHVTTQVMGTCGYAAPEYVTTGHLYVKSDVYSFGVVLLEALCGRRAIDAYRPRGEINLVEWAKPYLADRRKLRRVMDPRLAGEYSSKGALRASILALSCLCNDHKARPSMNEVLDVLENICSMDTKIKEEKNASSQLKPQGRSLLG